MVIQIQRQFYWSCPQKGWDAAGPDGQEDEEGRGLDSRKVDYNVIVWFVTKARVECTEIEGVYRFRQCLDILPELS